MNKNDTMKWEDIYKVWKWEMCKFPVLSAQKYCLKTEISKPRFGPCYSFNWIEKEREKESIESDVAALTSGRMEIEAGWSKGTIRTAALLCSCEKEEEFAAVWICAFVLSLTRGRSGGDETHRNAFNLEYEAAPVFARKYGYWHSNSREFFPEFYIPMELFWEDKKLSVSALVKLAALDAAVVIGNYTPVEYKKI